MANMGGRIRAVSDTPGTFFAFFVQVVLHGRRGAAFDTRRTLRYRLVSARILGLLRLSGPKPAVLLHGHAETHKKMVAVAAQYDCSASDSD